MRWTYQLLLVLFTITNINSDCWAEGGSSVSGARQMNQIERQILRNATCVWVPGVGASSDDEIRQVPAYRVPNCRGARNAQVCTGTARCRVNLGAGNFPLYVENVMCTSNRRNSCPTAKQCIRSGGVMANVTLGDVLNNEKGKDYRRYQPKKSKVHDGR